MQLTTSFALRFGLTGATMLAITLGVALSLFSGRLGTMGSSLSTQMEYATGAQLRLDSEALLNAAAEDIREDLENYDRAALERMVGMMLRHSIAETVRVYDRYGRTLATGNDGTGDFSLTAPPQMDGITPAAGIVRWRSGNRHYSARAVCAPTECFGAIAIGVGASMVQQSRAAADAQISLARRDFVVEGSLLAVLAVILGSSLAALIGWGMGKRMMGALRDAISALDKISTDPVAGHVVPIEQELGELQEAVARAAETMAAAEPERDAMLEDLSDGLLVARPDGMILIANPAAATILGVEADALLHKSLFATFGLAPLNEPDAICAALGAISVVRRSEGEDVPVMISARANSNKATGELRIIAVMRDLTERVEAEKQLMTAQLRAEAAERAKAQFLAVMSHELRTPLNGVLGGAAVLAKSDLTAEQRGVVGMMQSSGRSLLSMVSNVLSFARSDPATATVASVPVNLETTVQEIANSVADSAKEKGVALNVRIEPAVPGVLSDHDKIVEIGTQLAVNAVKFTSAGSITIALRHEHVGEDLAFTLEVADTGVGMTETEQESIFDLFAQADGSETRSFAGVGLGLTLAKRMTDLLKGDIELDSTPGEGSVFRVKLRAPIDPEAEPAPALPDLGGTRALLVAPSPEAAVVLSGYLQMAGARTDIVHTATDATAALDTARGDGDAFDLVVHPDTIPEFDTSGMARLLREDGTNGGVASVVLRDSAPDMAALTGMPLRVQHAVEPVNAHDLATAAEKAIRAVKMAPVMPMAPPIAPLPMPELANLKPAAPERAQHRVLLAEGNEVNRIVLSAYLKKAGFDVCPVNDSDAALAEFSETSATLVLMDASLPGMGGAEACRAIRQLEASRGNEPVPIIGLLPPNDTGAREACRAAGMNDLLVKPIKIEELEAKLERWTELMRNDKPAEAVPAS